MNILYLTVTDNLHDIYQSKMLLLPHYDRTKRNVKYCVENISCDN